MRPQLIVVVDTEEEFDWSKPFDPANRGTKSIADQSRLHEIYDELGIVPTYVIDDPVASDPAAVALLANMQQAGRAEIGTHLHPWVSPPHEETVNAHNSYHCNLSPDLERAKITALTDKISQNFGLKPTIFKAGRYGYGESTRRVLLDLGYKADCSFVPHVSFAADGGPAYYGTPAQPFWLDDEHKLLEIPLTSGFIGLAAAIGPKLAPLFDSRLCSQLRLPGILSRSGLLARSRLTPEGVSSTEQCRLVKTLVNQGQRIFTLTYHSPSLGLGYTPYVSSETDRVAFIACIKAVLIYFKNELGGEFTTISQIWGEYSAHTTPP